MKNVFLVISLLFLVGCGGGGSDSSLETIDNSDNDYNDYGFYGSTVRVGNEIMVGTYEVIVLQDGKELTSKKYPNDRMIYRLNKDGIIFRTIDGPSYNELIQNSKILGVDFNEANRWTNNGIYGINDNGTVLKFDLDDKFYVESIYKGTKRIKGEKCLVFTLMEKENFKINFCRTSI